MKLLAAALCLGAVAMAAPSHASDSQSGLVSIIYIMDDGKVLFNQAGVRTGPVPSCQGPGLEYRWAFNGATPAGQAKLATLLSAWSMKKPITIIGKGSCSDHPDTESVFWFRTDE
ncbi:hypothetical protein ASD79_01900 [Caulobacter sp. Root655]|uniref:hypothetical protein n=1 Tax=Caulobacter sp. Root655 TaxID=1736578 RepID=UPI0006F3D674|nr:hypothetical protein [Caulobacter sp. Root655]KRA66061.1 hypothetical protein ASD79_01900 [Caulobacter sp. Root655]